MRKERKERLERRTQNDNLIRKDVTGTSQCKRDKSGREEPR